MIIVYRRPGESTDELIRRFNKEVKKDGVLEDFIERQYYMKPSRMVQERKTGKKKR